jgi:hypothetical protein
LGGILNHLQRHDARVKHTSLYLIRCMQRPHPLSCDTFEIRTSTTNRNCGNSFLKNIFVVPAQKLGKLLQTKESVETYYEPVQRMAGRGYSNRGRVCAFFSCHSSLLRWQEYEAIYVKVRAHYPFSKNYVVKISAFEETLKPRNPYYLSHRGSRSIFFLSLLSPEGFKRLEYGTISYRPTLH